MLLLDRSDVAKAHGLDEVNQLGSSCPSPVLSPEFGKMFMEGSPRSISIFHRKPKDPNVSGYDVFQLGNAP